MIKSLYRRIKSLFVYDELDDVSRFYEKFNQPRRKFPGMNSVTRMKERADFMQEELLEFKAGLDRYSVSEMADALIDLVYVAKGTAIEMGLPWEELWSDVQRANMAKVPGITHRGIEIDVTKPPGWMPPQTKEILGRASHGKP